MLAVALHANHPIAEFRCGEPALDDFLKRFALRNEGTASRTFVLLRDETQPELPPLLGYYTLSMCSLTPNEAAPHHDQKLPRYPQLGAMLLARLARDERTRGLGVGDVLLSDALKRTQLSAQHAGCAGVLVDAKHERLLAFYEPFGFKQLRQTDSGWPRRLYLPLHVMRQVLAHEG